MQLWSVQEANSNSSLSLRVLPLFTLVILLGVSWFISPIDSGLWTGNGKLFLKALSHADFRGTYTYLDLNAPNHPGLSIEWISALIQLLLPSYLQNFLIPLHSLVFAALLLACLILGFSSLSKSFTKQTMMYSVAYIILLPNLILVPGATYLDRILSGTLFLSTALWIEYLNSRRFSLIFWVGILIGIAILTKYTAIFIFPAIFVVALVKNFPIKYLIKPLATIFLVSILFFIIFYPAVWVDPGHVLFSLFGKNESLFRYNLSLSVIREIWRQFLGFNLILNPMIYIGLLFTLVCLFTKKVKKAILLPGVAGFVYLVCIFISISLVFYTEANPFTSIYQLERYTLPATMLFAVTFFSIIFEDQRLKKSYLLSNILIILLFFYEVLKIATYIIYTYILY